MLIRPFHMDLFCPKMDWEFQDVNTYLVQVYLFSLSVDANIAYPNYSKFHQLS